MWYIWLIIAGICFVIEMITVGFFVFWFGIGALITMLVSLICPGNLWLQLIVFVATSTLLIFFTKPFVEKFTKKDKNVVTNAFSIIGKEAIVTEDIDSINGKGQIKIGGEIWSAKTDNNEIIPKDSKVEILSIDGVKVLVKAIKTTAKN